MTVTYSAFHLEDTVIETLSEEEEEEEELDEKQEQRKYMSHEMQRTAPTRRAHVKGRADSLHQPYAVPLAHLLKEAARKVTDDVLASNGERRKKDAAMYEKKILTLTAGVAYFTMAEYLQYWPAPLPPPPPHRCVLLRAGLKP